MFRVVSSNANKKRTLCALHFIRLCSKQNAPTEEIKRKSSKWWLYLLLGTGAGVGGTVGYASYDDSFRQTLEGSSPYAKTLLDYVIGEKTSSAKSATPIPALPEATTPKAVMSAKLSTLDNKSDAELEHSERASAADRRLAEKEAEKNRANKALESRLRNVISLLDALSRDAIEAKESASIAISHHANLVRKALEDFRNEKQDDVWDAAGKASTSLDFARKTSDTKDSSAKSEIEKLKRMVLEGRRENLTSSNPILLEAEKLINDLSLKLENASAKLREAENEHQITSQFKELVEKAREKFTKELKATLPNVDIKSKDKKLTEDELNSFLVHAYLQVDRLTQELAEHTTRERQHLEDAIGKIKADDGRESDLRVEREKVHILKEAELSLEKKMHELREQHDDELRSQLRRQAGAHAEHVEEVLRIQRETLETQFTRRLEEEKNNLRDTYQQMVAGAMGRLAGIEKALEGRKDMDDENRRAKELWVACRSFKERVVEGRDGRTAEQRRKPLANDVMRIREAAGDNPLVHTVISSLPDESVSLGVYTEADLIRRFQKVERLCRRTAMLSPEGGPLSHWFLSSLQSLFIFQSASNKPSNANEMVDPENTDTYDLIARANFFVQQRDFASAIKLMMLLNGEPGRIANDWINDTRIFLETQQAADVLQAHAAAMSIRTIY